jgi:phage terminase large subunit-like protein
VNWATKYKRSADLAPHALEEAKAYADAVISGDIVAGHLVKQAAKRFQRDLENLDAPFYMHEDGVQKIIRFFDLLKHVEGDLTGQPFVPSPWEVFILVNLFGWRMKDSHTDKNPGYRRFTEAYIEIAKKNGKSLFVSGIGLYMLCGDGEGGPKVYAAACTKEQAGLVFDAAVAMVKNSPALAERIMIGGGVHPSVLAVPNKNAQFKPLTAEKGPNQGRNIFCAIVDELHEHPNREVYDVVSRGRVGRRQPLLLCITNAGYNRNSICWIQHAHGVKVLDEVLQNDKFFAYIATIDDGDDHFDERVWAKANPNLGYGLAIEGLREAALKAKHEPTELNEFLRMHLTVWTSQDMSPFKPGAIDACCGAGKYADPKKLLEVALEKLKGRICYGGMDLSSKQDITALVLLFPPLNGLPRWIVMPWFWMPKDLIKERTEADKVPYDVWVREGFLQTTPGDQVDHKTIYNKVIELGKLFSIRQIGFDPWGFEWIGGELQEAGYQLFSIKSSYELLSEPTKAITGYINGTLPMADKPGEQKMEFLNNPIFKWMCSNVVVEKNAQGWFRPSKGKSAQKIDGFWALCAAMNRAQANPEQDQNTDPNRGRIRFI